MTTKKLLVICGLTAVAVREAGVWRFHQMQFSFETTSTPDVRNA